LAILDRGIKRAILLRVSYLLIKGFILPQDSLEVLYLFVEDADYEEVLGP
jgi:hypothetical protein